MKKVLLPGGSPAISVGRGGFTLTELLVSLAIVGILAALLIPTIKGVFEKGIQSKCVSNLRQLHLAMVNYAGDQGGLIVRAMGNPEGGGDPWSDVLASYVGMNPHTYGHPSGTRPQKVFACPKSKARVNGGARSDYAMNSKVQSPHTGTRKLSSVAASSKVIFLIDAAGPNDECTFHLSGATPPSGTWGIDFRHQGNSKLDGHANAVFFDGHVESRKLADFSFVGNYWEKLPWSPDATE